MSITIEVLKPETIPVKILPDTGQTVRQYFRVRATSDSGTAEDFDLDVTTLTEVGGLDTGFTAVGLPGAISIDNATDVVDRTWDVYLEISSSATPAQYTIFFANKYGLSGGATLSEWAESPFYLDEFGSPRETVRVDNVKRLGVIDGQVVEFLDWFEIAGPAVSNGLSAQSSSNDAANSNMSGDVTVLAPATGSNPTGQYFLAFTLLVTLNSATDSGVETVITVWTERNAVDTQRRAVGVFRLYPGQSCAAGGSRIESVAVIGEALKIGFTLSQSANCSYDVQAQSFRLGNISD